MSLLRIVDNTEHEHGVTILHRKQIATATSPGAQARGLTGWVESLWAIKV